MRFGWDLFRQVLAKAWTWTGVQTFTSLVATTADINGGTIDGVIVNEGYTTTATAAGTTTLTASSTSQQFFTGATTQTVKMPVTSTLALGQDYRIVNNSTGVVTVQSSGANSIVAMVPGSECILTCILVTGTTAASWDVKYGGIGSVTGTGSMVLGTDPAISCYKTLFVPAGAMTPCATNGPDLLSNEYVTNDINMDYLAFDATTEEFADFQFPMDEAWDRSTIKAKFFWTSATGSTSGDTVEWELQAGALSDSDAIDAALGTAQVISDTLLADNGTDLQVSDATPAITVGGTPALGDLVHFKVSRNVGGTDDMTEDAWLFGIWIQYKVTNSVSAW
jgi:hypothetical protein